MRASFIWPMTVPIRRFHLSWVPERVPVGAHLSSGPSESADRADLPGAAVKGVSLGHPHPVDVQLPPVLQTHSRDLVIVHGSHPVGTPCYR